MAIQKPTQSLTYSLQEEIASRVLLLTRDVIDKGDGTIATTFGAQVYPKSITYELGQDGSKVAIYDSKDMDMLSISTEELMTLFGIPVTLTDGTVSVIGEIISSFIDQIIKAKLGLNDVTLTTQPVPLPTAVVDPTPTPDPAP